MILQVILRRHQNSIQRINYSPRVLNPRRRLCILVADCYRYGGHNGYRLLLTDTPFVSVETRETQHIIL